MQVAYFVNSGSEANDLAVLMARLHTGNYDLVALRNCYHGLSETTMGMMGNSGWRQPVPCVISSGPPIHDLHSFDVLAT